MVLKKSDGSIVINMEFFRNRINIRVRKILLCLVRNTLVSLSCTLVFGEFKAFTSHLHI